MAPSSLKAKASCLSGIKAVANEPNSQQAIALVDSIDAIKRQGEEGGEELSNYMLAVLGSEAKRRCHLSESGIDHMIARRYAAQGSDLGRNCRVIQYDFAVSAAKTTHEPIRKRNDIHQAFGTIMVYRHLFEPFTTFSL